MVAFLLKLVESKNKQGYGSNLVQFWESCLNQGIKLAQDKSVSASSLCEARQKLSEDIFIELNKELVVLWNKTPDLPTLLHKYLICLFSYFLGDTDRFRHS